MTCRLSALLFGRVLEVTGWKSSKAAQKAHAPALWVEGVTHAGRTCHNGHRPASVLGGLEPVVSMVAIRFVCMGIGVGWFKLERVCASASF